MTCSSKPEIVLDSDKVRAVLPAFASIFETLDIQTSILLRYVEEAQRGDPHKYLNGGISDDYAAAGASRRAVAELRDVLARVLQTLNAFDQLDRHPFEERKGFTEFVSPVWGSLWDINPDVSTRVGKFSGSLLEVLRKLLENRKATYLLFKDGGRYLNAILETRGYVTKSEIWYKLIFGTKTDQGRFLKDIDVLDRMGSKVRFGFVFFGLDVALGISEDVYSKEYVINGSGEIDWTKTVLVNFVDGGITTAISAIWVGPVPVGLIVLFVNAGVQLGGTLLFSAQGWYNNVIASESNRQLLKRDVEIAEDALDRADLGKVTKSVAELAYDTGATSIGDIKNGWEFVTEVASNPSWNTFTSAGASYMSKAEDSRNKRLEAIKNTGMTTLRFVDGASDLQGSIQNAVNNTTTATFNGIIQKLPVNDDIKSKIDKVSTKVIEDNQRRTEQQVNTWNFESDNWRSWLTLP